MGTVTEIKIALAMRAGIESEQVILGADLRERRHKECASPGNILLNPRCPFLSTGIRVRQQLGESAIVDGKEPPREMENRCLRARYCRPRPIQLELSLRDSIKQSLSSLLVGPPRKTDAPGVAVKIESSGQEDLIAIRTRKWFEVRALPRSG